MLGYLYRDWKYGAKDNDWQRAKDSCANDDDDENKVKYFHAFKIFKQTYLGYPNSYHH